VLEFYDLIIYIFLSPIIEKVFFSDSSAQVATLKTLAIFSIGYLLRPLGGILFSHFGDRYGRKTVFLLTILFMALPSFAIGLLPTPAEIGIAAPILLLLFRMMQGLALGGEIPAAITFVAEHAPTGRRGFALATLFFGVNLGLMLGSGTATIVTSVFSASDLLQYGWRIPFLIGGVFGIASISLRRYLHETHAFTALRKQEIVRIPLLTLLKHSRNSVLQGILLVALGSVSVILFLYWPQYLHQYFNYDFALMLRINTAGSLILNFSVLLGGIFADRYGSRKLYLIGASLIIVFTYPLFMLFATQQIVLVITAYMIFSILFGFIPSAYCIILNDLFPTPIRYSGIALSYNLAFAFFGGLTPVLLTLAIESFNFVLAPAVYIICVTIFSWCACYVGRHQPIYDSLNDTPASSLAMLTNHRT
jgi:MHS family proline/betaine transporter-like MFS transporter